MSAPVRTSPLLRHSDRLFIGGDWVRPSSADLIDVIDSGTEEVFLSVPAANATDMERAVGAARRAFDDGPWPQLSHAERADVLRALGAGIQARANEFGETWTREAGVVSTIARATPGVVARV